MQNIKYKTLLLVILALIFLHYLKVISPIENLIVQILKPLQNIVYNKTLDLKESDSDKEKKKLEDLIQQLSIENANLKILKEENKELKKLLEFKKEEKNELLGARVIGRESERKIIIIDRGARDKVRIGFPVISGEGQLVGKVISVKETLSRVLLLIDNQSAVAASIVGKEIVRIAGVVEGSQGLSLEMNLIPQNVVINREDLVVTSGLEESTPEGLIIGRILGLLESKNSLFQKAQVDPYIDFDNIRIVAVILK